MVAAAAVQVPASGTAAVGVSAADAAAVGASEAADTGAEVAARHRKYNLRLGVLAGHR